MSQEEDFLHQEQLCILEEVEKGFNIGIIGTGTGFESILQLTRNPDLEEFFPRLNLVALSQPYSRDRRLRKALEMGVKLYESHHDMLKAHPEINLVIELTDKQHMVKKLRKSLPANISMVDHNAATFLCGMLIMAEVSNKCRLNLKQQRALFEAVTDQIQDDILLLNTSGVIQDVNMGVVKRMDRKKEDIIGKHCWELFACSDASSGPGFNGTECPFRTTMEEHRPAEAMQTWVDEQGRAHYFRIYTYPVFDAAGQLSRVVEMRRDITVRTEMEKRLQQSEKLAAIGELSTYIAHEIRNPLFAIGGFANAVLRNPDLDAVSRDKVNIILQESKRLDRILKSIINFARPTEPVQQEVDVNGVVQEVMQLFNLTCKEQDVSIEMEMPPNMAKARGDPELLKQCIINLVKNALEAMPEGGTLGLETFVEWEFVVIEVSDTGKGISKEIRDKIFNPFYSTKENSGAGLGLAMTKKILDDMGGKIDVLSLEGQGTSITIRLPLFPAMPEDEK
ncbi:PAS/PAC sensor signal transduction histidine kinase [Desulfonatronospira thiodismutans ASO3-1]|uniref:histidine kinase n=1 Tax=Desulfonatronospira thiodismutans ASO3-1 TaxID=555779 RepID=D6SPL1_9BACT|nr:ATP-binding protein [Desulfonatronospira thiodismutans]EFI34687.1 PAS/PAC sensor signal transduction histidine kinase [Desulfonatronospira thiodismutans ASO3-1]